ncbi:MAG: hypothetical protein WCO44_02075 [Bacteroidota bacterium]
MKKTILFFALFFVWSVSVVAQEPSTEPAISREEGTKLIVDNISPKLNLNKVQKDSLMIIFRQFMENVQTYHAQSNPKVFAFMIQNRDGNVKKLLRDSLKFDKYLLVLEDIKNQPIPIHDSRQQNNQGSPHRTRGSNGMGSGMGRTY